MPGAIPGEQPFRGHRGCSEPAHRVSVSAFLVDRHEVTNGQFARFVAETGHRTDAEKEGKEKRGMLYR